MLSLFLVCWACAKTGLLARFCQNSGLDSTLRPTAKQALAQQNRLSLTAQKGPHNIQDRNYTIIQVYMCIKLSSRDLNPSFFPPIPQEFCTCGVTIMSRVRGGKIRIFKFGKTTKYDFNHFNATNQDIEFLVG